MQVQFIAQSFNPTREESTGSIVAELLESGQFTSLLVLSAFASASGVGFFRTFLETATLASATFIVGVDQQGTSREALEALLGWQAEQPMVRSGVFYQPESVTYHPKIYLLEGPQRVQVLVGSANLTGAGLFRNVEAGTLLTLQPQDVADAEWLATFREQLAGFYTFSEPNVQPLTASLIAELVRAGLLPDDDIVRQRYAKRTIAPATDAGAIKTLFPKRKVAGVARRAPKRRAPVADTAVPIDPADAAPPYQLVWERAGLPASSVQQAGSGTNPTGGLRLVQARFRRDDGRMIDQTTYFRQDLFGQADWITVSENPFVEAAAVLFEVAIAGKELGIIPLSIRHKPSGEAGQHNYTTSISWGTLGKVIQDANLVGKTVRLFRSATTPALFRLELR